MTRATRRASAPRDPYGLGPARPYIGPALAALALVIVGVIIVTVGALLWSGIGTGPLGRLPGDIRIERGGSGFYFPIVTCLVISAVLSFIFWLLRR